MYIGPWQEFKLAKILQLKDKVDKEEHNANKLENKAPSSLSNQGQLVYNQDPKYSNSEGFKNYNYNERNSEAGRFSEKARSNNSSKSRSRKSYYSNPKKVQRHRSNNIQKPGPPRQQRFGNIPNGMNHQQNRGIIKANKSKNRSPVTNNTNYSSGMMKSTSNSFKNGDNNSSKSYKQPSHRTMKGRSNDRTSFMGSTNNSESRSYASHMIHEMRKKNFFNNFSNQNMNRCIEVTYDKWNRFENFVKFASNKEKKEKLQQLDPPPIEQYVDGDTVYKIRGMGQGRPPKVTKRPLVSKKEVKMEHKDRVSKMKALYGIGANPNPIPNPLHDTPREEKKDKMPSGNVFDYQQNSKNAYAEETKYTLSKK